MTTIRHRELINQDLLDENGLRKKPYEHEKLTRDERKVVIRFTDQSYLRVVLVNGNTVRLRELRDHLYQWFPDLEPLRYQRMSVRAAREPITVHRKRLQVDDEFKSKVKELVDRITYSDTNTLDVRRGGKVSIKSICDDFLYMEAIADLAILLDWITIPESTAIFNELFPCAQTHNPSYLWMRAAFLTRFKLEETYLLQSIHRVVIPHTRLEFDDEARRLQLNVYMDYRKYKVNKTELIDRPEHLTIKLTELSEASQNRLLSEQIKTIGCYGDRVLIRMQYLLIEKILKPLQRK